MPRQHPRHQPSDRKSIPRATCTKDAPSALPVVDHSRCEAKRDCVDVCPYGVFEVRTISNDDYRSLGLLGRIRSTAHGRQTAYPVRADACHACGLCVHACPENAITLTPIDDAGKRG